MKTDQPHAPSLLWFRNDLRLDDNPALLAALRRGAPVCPVFVLETKPGGASAWWLHHSLEALARALEGHGLRLHLAAGDAGKVIPDLCRSLGAGHVYWNRRYDPEGRAADAGLEQSLARMGTPVETFPGSLLFEPPSVEKKQGGAFQVFTPFWRTCLDLGFEAPVESLPALRRQAPPAARPAGGSELRQLGLLPGIPWDSGLKSTWTPGEQGAQGRLKDFLRKTLQDYDRLRDLPAIEGCSRLSPHLHFGELGPRRIVALLREAHRESGVFPSGKGEERFLAELGWREFAHHLLYHFPRTPSSPLRPEFERFPWRADPGGRLFKAWRQGRTGYPVVDAGMRQLWATGWMHNRVRMLAASFLVKHLRLPWQQGAAWFMETLVDADLASNTLGWQWTAGCGADAAPYFRIFNPVLQGERFDPDGTYVRRWVPELAGLSADRIHRPWEAPLIAKGYPEPLVEHARARQEALEAFRSLSART